ncbi:MAG TPA: OmpA family protein [Flavobacteriales bacterium]|nr:OmpA family protein [Flavobacteriales bacterium]
MRSNRTPFPLLALAALTWASCASYHVKRGDQAMALLAYSKADEHFNKALKQGQDRSILLRAAVAEAKQNKIEQAAAHYAAAEQQAPLIGQDAYDYGRLLMAQGQYDQAHGLLRRAWDELPERKDVAELIGACEGYLSFYSDSAKYGAHPLEFSGVASAYAAVPHGNGLLFTGQRPANTAKRDPWSGQSFADLYTIEVDGEGNAGTPNLLRGTVNGPYHEGPAVVSPDGKSLYFTRSNYYGNKLLKDQENISNLKLFRATLLENGEWGNISEFPYNSDRYSVGHPALSNDGNTLYFTSDMPGGRGGKDLWYCTNLGTGWAAPVNMGPTINTAGDEMFPTVVGDAFYFSSTAHENMGGLDIFETHREDEYWSEPRNMGYPINSTRDDLGLWLDGTGTHGFLSSARAGNDWIYRITIRPPTFALEGTIVNAETGEPVPHALVILQNIADLMHLEVTTDADGHFQFDLDANRAYIIRAEARGLLSQSTMLGTVGMGISTTLRTNLRLHPNVPDKPIVVPNIFYDYDKWDIRPDAARELDKLAQVFLDNPGLTFELGSHTDSRGSDLYNLVLSDARARSAVDYLVRKGVPQERLVARGYGETMLVNKCSNGVSCTEEEHQANRRTEFKVLAPDNAGLQP